MDGRTSDRDLHDTVIQRLFGAGLTLRSTRAAIADAAVRERVRQSVTVLAEVIDEVRSRGGDAPRAQRPCPRRLRSPQDGTHARVDGVPAGADRLRAP